MKLIVEAGCKYTNICLNHFELNPPPASSPCHVSTINASIGKQLDLKMGKGEVVYKEELPI